LNVPLSRSFSSSFLAGEPAALAFLARDFRDLETRRVAPRVAARRRVSPALVAVLAEQQARLPASAARDANLGALAEGRAAVVVSGQQVGLFLGPLYSFYKAASAVAVARALEAESGVRTVPMFWLQTEDHDFAEIASCHVDDAGVPVTLSLPAEGPAEARVSVAHRRLAPEVSDVVDALAAAVGPGPAADEVVALLRAAYVPGRSPAQAFALVLAAIFADEGLLVFDPRDARVAALAAPLYRRALDDAAPLSAALEARGAALAAAGLGAQIPLRADCALVFFHPRGVEGPRFRLRRLDRGWGVAGSEETSSDAELRALLEAAPLRFSTSALLRPLVQDALLPTAAYVGGPAELSYFAQLGPLYEAFGLAQPLVVPRARFRVLEAPTRRRLEQLGLSASDVAPPRDGLLARLDARAGGPPLDPLGRLIAERLGPAVGDLERAAVEADPALARPAARTRATIERALERLAGRQARGRRERDAVVVARADKLLAALVPEGVPQERFYAWPALAARLGIAPFKRLVLDHLAADPFSTALQELTP
jgi:bacillithiol biosynthesis cysteine-adding enzyme BshC